MTDDEEDPDAVPTVLNDPITGPTKETRPSLVVTPTLINGLLSEINMLHGRTHRLSEALTYLLRECETGDMKNSVTVIRARAVLTAANAGLDGSEDD